MSKKSETICPCCGEKNECYPNYMTFDDKRIQTSNEIICVNCQTITITRFNGMNDNNKPTYTETKYHIKTADNKTKDTFTLEPTMDDFHKECLMSFKEFIKHVNFHGIIDYDGNGTLVYKNQRVTNSDTWLAYNAITIDDNIYAMEDLYEFFKNDISICWYNK